MVRVKRGKVARRRRKKVFRRAKGFRGGLRTQYNRAKDAVYHAMRYATRHRKTRKRDMRRLWIVRINAALKAFGMKYSRFIAALKKSKITLDRKMLADLAVNHPAHFGKIIEAIKKS